MASAPRAVPSSARIIVRAGAMGAGEQVLAALGVPRPPAGEASSSSSSEPGTALLAGFAVMAGPHPQIRGGREREGLFGRGRGGGQSVEIRMPVDLTSAKSGSSVSSVRLSAPAPNDFSNLSRSSMPGRSSVAQIHP